MAGTNSFTSLLLWVFVITAILLLIAMTSPGIFAAISSVVDQVDFSESHGPAKHGTITADHVRLCLDKNGPTLEWQNPITGRRARVCEVVPGKFGIQIIRYAGDGIWKEITVFIKEKFTSLDQVIRYLANTGYTPLQ